MKFGHCTTAAIRKLLYLPSARLVSHYVNIYFESIRKRNLKVVKIIGKSNTASSMIILIYPDYSYIKDSECLNQTTFSKYYESTIKLIQNQILLQFFQQSIFYRLFRKNK